MKRFLLLAGCAVLWSNVVLAQGEPPDLIFEHGFENHPDAVEILGLKANPASVYEGDSTTISWELKDADNCVATDGTPEWQALVLNGDDGSFEVTTLITQGVYPFTLTCTGMVGDDVVDTVNFVVSVAPPVQILSFTASPATIEEGESTTLSWTVQDGVSCTTSDGTAQWQALTLDGSSNSVEITDLDTDGVFPFALNCTGIAGDTDAAVTTVTVEILTCEAPTLDAGFNISWFRFWGDRDFPNTSTQAVSQPINHGQFLSIQFDTGTVVNNGRLLTVDNTFTEGTRLGTVSRCIGRFEAPAVCTHTWADAQGDTTGIDWSTDGKVGACALKPNTTYYFNVTFTDGLDSSTRSCITADCIATIKHDLNP